jgi:hypothetical protein
MPPFVAAGSKGPDFEALPPLTIRDPSFSFIGLPSLEAEALAAKGIGSVLLLEGEGCRGSVVDSITENRGEDAPDLDAGLDADGDI